MNKTFFVITRCLIGGYLIYLGINLLRNLLYEETLQQDLLFTFAGILFIAVGAVIIFRMIKFYIAFKKEEGDTDEPITAEEETELEDAIEKVEEDTEENK